MLVGLTLALVVISAVAACTDSHEPSPVSPTITTRTMPAEAATPVPETLSTITVAPKTCPDASGITIASDGVLSLGPFSSPQPGAEQKLWVASQREGADDAILRVTDPTGHTTRLVRPSGQASVDNAAQFYPGTIPVTTSGQYKLRVTVGHDEICVTAAFYAAS
jgi:hypothetical protein